MVLLPDESLEMIYKTARGNKRSYLFCTLGATKAFASTFACLGCIGYLIPRAIILMHHVKIGDHLIEALLHISIHFQPLLDGCCHYVRCKVSIILVTCRK